MRFLIALAVDVSGSGAGTNLTTSVVPPATVITRSMTTGSGVTVTVGVGVGAGVYVPFSHAVQLSPPAICNDQAWDVQHVVMYPPPFTPSPVFTGYCAGHVMSRVSRYEPGYGSVNAIAGVLISAQIVVIVNTLDFTYYLRISAQDRSCSYRSTDSNVS